MLLSHHLCICYSCCLVYSSPTCFMLSPSLPTDLRPDMVRKAFLGLQPLSSPPLYSLKYCVYICLVYLLLVGCKTQEGEYFLKNSLLFPLCLHQCLTRGRWFLCICWLNDFNFLARHLFFFHCIWCYWLLSLALHDTCYLLILIFFLPASYLSSFVVFFLPQYVPLNSLLCFFYHLLYINYSWPVLFMLCAFITISFLISLKWHLHQRHPCITAPDLGISLDSSCKYCHALSSPANLLFYSSTLVNKPPLNPGQNTGVILDLAFLHCSHQVVH